MIPWCGKSHAELDIPVQELRKYLIDHLDMMLLENLPARAEMADTHADRDDPVARALGREKYSRYLRSFPMPQWNPFSMQ